MVWAYFAGDKREVIPAKEVEAEIKKLTDWQEKAFGYYLDTTVAETAQMIREVYKLDAKVVESFDEEDIKQALVEDKLVILTVNGRKIGNPNYKPPGPKYHMLVVRGFEGGTVITNDPGTRRGQNYKYTFKTLLNAATDWDHATNDIDEMVSKAIVVSR
jgi:hypothetical protein